LSIRNEELVAFTQQFSNLINAGIVLSKALRVLEEQEENNEFKRVIGLVRLEVEDGGILSEALAKHPKVFSHFFVSMVYAGEQGAGLPKVLNRIADHLEKDESLRARVRSVFTYPIVVGVLAVLIVIFLVVFVTPVFADIYQQLKIALPLPTRLLLGISFVIRVYWWLLAAVAIAAYYYYQRLKQQPTGQDLFQSVVMSIPLLGKFLHKVAVARFARTFGDMMLCGVPIIDSLAITKKVADNKKISTAIDQVIRAVQTGGTLAGALSASELFPPVLVQMAYAGEESGNIGTMFEKCADNLDQDVESSAKRLLVMIEPSMTFLLAGVVGFIALAIYLPMFDLVSLVTK